MSNNQAVIDQLTSFRNFLKSLNSENHENKKVESMSDVLNKQSVTEKLDACREYLKSRGFEITHQDVDSIFCIPCDKQHPCNIEFLEKNPPNAYKCRCVQCVKQENLPSKNEPSNRLPILLSSQVLPIKSSEDENKNKLSVRYKIVDNGSLLFDDHIPESILEFFANMIYPVESVRYDNDKTFTIVFKPNNNKTWTQKDSGKFSRLLDCNCIKIFTSPENFGDKFIIETRHYFEPVSKINVVDYSKKHILFAFEDENVVKSIFHICVIPKNFWKNRSISRVTLKVEQYDSLESYETLHTIPSFSKKAYVAPSIPKNQDKLYVIYKVLNSTARSNLISDTVIQYFANMIFPVESVKYIDKSKGIFKIIFKQNKPGWTKDDSNKFSKLLTNNCVNIYPTGSFTNGFIFETQNKLYLGESLSRVNYKDLDGENSILFAFRDENIADAIMDRKDTVSDIFNEPNIDTKFWEDRETKRSNFFVEFLQQGIHKPFNISNLRVVSSQEMPPPPPSKNIPIRREYKSIRERLKGKEGHIRASSPYLRDESERKIKVNYLDKDILNEEICLPIKSDVPELEDENKNELLNLKKETEQTRDKLLRLEKLVIAQQQQIDAQTGIIELVLRGLVDLKMKQEGLNL